MLPFQFETTTQKLFYAVNRRKDNLFIMILLFRHSDRHNHPMLKRTVKINNWNCSIYSPQNASVTLLYTTNRVQYS